MDNSEEIKQFVIDLFRSKFSNIFYYEMFDDEEYLIIVDEEDLTFYSDAFQDFASKVELFILQPNNIDIKFAKEN